MVSVLLKTVESLFPRGSGEIEPGIKGPHAHGSPMPLPYPTSILGILSTVLIGEGYSLEFISSGIEDWYRDFELLFNGVKGPYLLVSDGNMNYVVVSSSPSGFARLETIYLNSLKIWETLDYGLWDEYRSIKGKLVEYRLENLAEERVLIALRDDKTVREHYFTALRLVDYRFITKYFSSEYSDREYAVFLGIDVELKGKSTASMIIGDGSPVRAFGRGRAAVLRLDKRNILESKLENMLNNTWVREIEDKRFILFLISPLIISENALDASRDILAPSTVYPHQAEITAYLRREIADTCSITEGELEIIIDGAYSAIGLGYSLRFRERKPPFSALLPGTIIYVKPKKRCRAEPKRIYRRGLGMLRQLGFGTAIPIL